MSLGMTRNTTVSQALRRQVNRQIFQKYSEPTNLSFQLLTHLTCSTCMYALRGKVCRKNFDFMCSIHFFSGLCPTCRLRVNNNTWCTLALHDAHYFLCQREVLRQIRKRIVWGLVLISTHYQSQTLCRPLACSYCTSWSTNNEACLKIPIRNSFAVNYCLWEVFGCDSCFYSSQLSGCE